MILALPIYFFPALRRRDPSPRLSARPPERAGLLAFLLWLKYTTLPQCVNYLSLEGFFGVAEGRDQGVVTVRRAKHRPLKTMPPASTFCLSRTSSNQWGTNDRFPPTSPIFGSKMDGGFGALSPVPAPKAERPVSVQTLCPWAVAGGPP